MSKRVRDLMRPSLITCPPSTTLGDAAALMARHNIHALVVADAAGLAIGVVSDVDLLAAKWLIGDPAATDARRGLTAGELMTKPVAAIDGDSPAIEAAERMGRERLHRLVVTELERPVGIIAISDLVRDLAPQNGEHQTVEQAMSSGIVACREHTTISAAARAMRERRSRTVVVVNAQGRPLGVVTGFDLLPFCDGGDAGQPISGLMHAPITIAPTASLRQAAELMLQRRIHRLLVVDPSETDAMPLGLISTSDIIAEIAAPGAVGRGRA